MSQLDGWRVKLCANDFAGMIRPAKVIASGGPHEILAKLALVGKALDDYSRETVEMLRRDARAVGYAIAATAASERTPVSISTCS
jgi:hypothetical protein